MLRIFRSGRRAYEGFRKTAIQKRSFLSEAYRCEEAWNARLQIPLLQKYNPEDLFMTLQHKYATDGLVSAVDIDIFVNIVRTREQVEELLNLLESLRQSAETTNTLDSTHHAVVRYLLDHGCTSELMDVLHNRLKYGIFPDHVCYNLLMDTYIKKMDYASAAKIAVLPMLQEDSENPITNALSLYACHKYLEDSSTWVKPPEPEQTSKEEIKIRVKYLRNPYFDDHFDITEPCKLVGKTLAFQGRTLNNALGRTCQLRGLVLYEKYQTGTELIKQWLNEVEGNIVYEEVFHLIKEDYKDISKQAANELQTLIEQILVLKEKSTCKDSLIKALENNVKSAVEKQQDVDINNQVQAYTNWEKQRQATLDKQLFEMKRQTKMEDINELKKYLAERERLLTFFENEEQIELEVEKREEEERLEMKRVLKKPKALKKLKKLEEETEYVPPKLEHMRK
ncbi:uncharacterized protein LOC143429666 [Xylocopa sonorina]|uniref:uncharacterized protein LOC143429666 n=1 Tax=Xylocopa sonorina TaxID=1818115 RepID=UPI00403AA5CF